ncbi:MAG: metallophosphoesterase [Bacteroidales bacterium]|nr:metallophosphoesterase [Bacteroidales bacterium]
MKILAGIAIWSSLLLLSCENKKQPQAPENEFTFAFMTDIHLQPESNATEGFNAAIDTLNRLLPDFVITGGDLIMDALGVNYERADRLYTLYKEASARFQMPVYNTMGNHEIFGIYPESGVTAGHPEYGEKMFENRIGKRYFSFSHQGWLFIILDSVDDTGKGSYTGVISREQIEWLKSLLAKTDTLTPVAISVHIPLLTTFLQYNYGPLECNSETLVVTNASEVLDLFKKHNLKLVMQGHTHFLEDLYVNRIHFISGGAVSARWWKGANRGLEEGFLLFRVKGENFSWEYIDYGWKVEQE